MSAGKQPRSADYNKPSCSTRQSIGRSTLEQMAIHPAIRAVQVAFLLSAACLAQTTPPPAPPAAPCPAPNQTPLKQPIRQPNRAPRRPPPEGNHRPPSSSHSPAKPANPHRHPTLPRPTLRLPPRAPPMPRRNIRSLHNLHQSFPATTPVAAPAPATTIPVPRPTRIQHAKGDPPRGHLRSSQTSQGQKSSDRRRTRR